MWKIEGIKTAELIISCSDDLGTKRSLVIFLIFSVCPPLLHFMYAC